MPSAAKAPAGATLKLGERVKFLSRLQLQDPLVSKTEELQKLASIFSNALVEFGGSAEASIGDAALPGFRELAEALRVYPELHLHLEGYNVGGAKNREEELQRLSFNRAAAVKRKLQELCVVNEITVEGLPNRGSSGKAHGYVSFLLKVDVELKGQQQRMDYILSRGFFEFVQSSDKFTEKGLLIAHAISEVLKEKQNKVFITCPKRSSQLALRRADAIVKGLHDAGVESEILVKIAFGDQELVTLSIEESPQQADPQRSSEEVKEDDHGMMEANSRFIYPDGDLPSLAMPRKDESRLQNQDMMVKDLSRNSRDLEAVEAEGCTYLQCHKSMMCA
eukprot:TRINITY_DN68711_c0_g1_i1.p1 TRINITY_DN68711_c0_g1~~TRINITY_DN68711_c0_g1_i1.p1  ORF type:complete len:335 (+),score=73.68 TRINITY_DN68711_c0_g1_i1:115-1119(+)